MAHDKQFGLEIDNRSGYDITDIVRLYMLISRKPMGRTALIRELKLGEATVKTMMRFLKDKGIVDQGTRGVSPTSNGISMFSVCKSFSGLIAQDIPEFSNITVALVVKNAASNVRSGIEQRDEGIRFGAKIITLIRRDGGLILAGVPEHEPPYIKGLEKELEIENNDVVVLSGADSALAAERGAVAAALKTVS